MVGLIPFHVLVFVNNEVRYPLNFPRHSLLLPLLRFLSEGKYKIITESARVMKDQQRKG